MTDTIFDQDDTLSVRLPWPTICALACSAFLAGQSLDAWVASAIEDYLGRAPDES